MIAAPLTAPAGAPGQVPVAPAPDFVPGSELAQAQPAVAQATADVSAATAPAYAGGTPDGSLTSTPRQAAADLLNSGERQKGLETEEGRIKSDEATKTADVHAAAAAEKNQQAADYNDFLAKSQQRFNEEHAQTQAAYDKYKAAAGTLKDPEAQFYEDKGQGYRVQTALAAFAAGIGAGFNGQQGNPVLDLLQKKIQANYESHKQNIEDLYNSGVQSGKIEDTSENHARFMQDAKLRSYELQSAHVKDELASIAARAQSPLAKTAAAKSIEQIEEKEIGTRQALAAKEAAAGAAGLASQRARAAEVRAAFKDAYDKNLAQGSSPEEASVAATKLVHSMGFNASETAPIFQANGVQTDPKTGEPVFPARAPDTSPSEPTYDQDGKLHVPTHDADTGKPLKPEERQKIAEEARKRTVVVEGVPRLAASDEAAKQFAVVQSELPHAEKLYKTLNDAFQSGDKGTYDSARKELIEVLPKVYGFTRGPSGAQAGEGGGHTEGEGGTLSDQIPEFNPTLLGRLSQGYAGFSNRHTIGGNSETAIAQAKLQRLGTSLGSIKEEAFKAAFPSTAEGRKKETIAKTPVAQLAAAFGGKPVAK